MTSDWIKRWLWRLLQHSFFIGRRSDAVHITMEICRKCNLSLEEVNHLFKNRWQNFLNRASQVAETFGVAGSLLRLLDKSLAEQKKNSFWIFFLVGAHENYMAGT